MPTAESLDHFKHEVNEVLGGIADGSGARHKARVALLAGSDLLQTMSRPGVWSPEDLERILGDGSGGMYVLERYGTDLDDARSSLGRWADNITGIPQNIPIDLSSTKVRLMISRGLSVKYFVPNPVREPPLPPSPLLPTPLPGVADAAGGGRSSPTSRPTGSTCRPKASREATNRPTRTRTRPYRGRISSCGLRADGVAGVGQAGGAGITS